MAFVAALESHKITVSVRQTRGLDANAACGQLRNQFQKNPLLTDTDSSQSESAVAVACWYKNSQLFAILPTSLCCIHLTLLCPAGRTNILWDKDTSRKLYRDGYQNGGSQHIQVCLFYTLNSQVVYMVAKLNLRYRGALGADRAVIDLAYGFTNGGFEIDKSWRRLVLTYLSTGCNSVW